MAASGQAPAAAAADSVDPVYEWLDDDDSYLLRLNLPEFKKEDFRVHVDGEGRLTVIGQRRPAPGAEGKPTRLYKTFQLPNTANLDAISGRFDGTVLSLRVPKLPQQQQQQQQPTAGTAAPPPPPMQAKAEESQVAGGGGKPAGAQENMAAKADRDAKPTKPVAPPPPPSEKVATAGGDDEDEKAARAEAEHRENVSREAARRIEAARARVAEAKAKAERERQCEDWKERVVEEGLKLADAVGRRKEVIATAVAAFTLGVFVSQKLFSRS